MLQEENDILAQPFPYGFFALAFFLYLKDVRVQKVKQTLIYHGYSCSNNHVTMACTLFTQTFPGIQYLLARLCGLFQSLDRRPLHLLLCDCHELQNSQTQSQPP